MSALEILDGGERLDAERQMYLRKNNVCESREQVRKMGQRKQERQKLGIPGRPSGKFTSETFGHHQVAIVPFLQEPYGMGRLWPVLLTLE